jgi:hypothetical protein
MKTSTPCPFDRTCRGLRPQDYDCGGCAEPEPEPEPDPCETCGNADCAEDCDKYKQWLTKTEENKK